MSQTAAANPNQAQVDRLTGEARAFYDSFTRNKPRVDIVGDRAVFTWEFTDHPPLSPMQTQRAYSPHATAWALRSSQQQSELDATRECDPAAETTKENESCTCLTGKGETWNIALRIDTE